MLALSALAFAGIGGAFLLAPSAMAQWVGVSLSGALADNDVRAVYGGLQLGCTVFLGICSTRDAWLRPGLVMQQCTFAGLAGARLLSLALAGWPGPLGVALLAAEAVGLGCGALALRRLRAYGEGL